MWGGGISKVVYIRFLDIECDQNPTLTDRPSLHAEIGFLFNFFYDALCQLQVLLISRSFQIAVFSLVRVS